MKILKFGGSSIGTSGRIENVLNILRTYKNEKIGVVFSAFQGVTDELISVGTLAQKGDTNYKNILNLLRERHFSVITELNGKARAKQIQKKVILLLDELCEIIHGVQLLRELTPRSLDYIMSFGERLSCTIISETLKTKIIKNEYLNATKLIITDSNFNYARVDFNRTNKNIKKYFNDHKTTQIITGFIAANEKGEITTLGRGGSDYTSSIIGAALNVDEIQIWTDVDGILTADPRKVSDSFPLKAVTYEEAMELSHFGAKVIHLPTMLPAMSKKIKIRIKNTFNPSFKGTVILEKEKSISFNVKGISSIEEISLLRIQGGGMVGVTGIASRLFDALARNDINIIMISQGSSEHSICFAVLPQNSEKAKQAIDEEFRIEIQDKKISNVIIENDLSIIAVVGEDMNETPGVSGKVFQSLGHNGINIHAIAQGSSELNISLVVGRPHLSKAMNVLHEALFISKQKTLNLFMIGPGLVGSELLDLIARREEYLKSEFKIRVKLIGLANSKKMTFNKNGIALTNWRKLLKSSKVNSNINSFIDKIKIMNLPNSIFIDCTASELVPSLYNEVLSSSISIVTPNKIANSGKYSNYLKLKKLSRENNVQFRYGTNVGAALPIINTIRDLVTNGDKVLKIEGVLSGTLSYIFNSLKENKKFSQIVIEANKKDFTEPDPRDDLSGLDVARKLLILIRESGIEFEMKNIKVESLIQKSLNKIKNVNEFLNKLKLSDDEFDGKIKKAANKNNVLCYIAKYENGKASVKIEEINCEHPFYNLKGNDNIVAFTTNNYTDKPLVIKGPGAGAEFTASGVFVDILRISNYLS